MNELVRLTTQDIGKGIPVTDTKIISEKLGIAHRHIKKHINEHRSYFLSYTNGLLVVCATESTGGRPEEIYQLTEEQALFLMTLLKNTEKVVEFKYYLISAFSAMKKELAARLQTRHISVFVRKNLTDTIKNCVTDEGNFKKWAYSTYSKLVYKKVLGKDVKKAKAERNVKEKENIRDYLTIEELEKVQDLESKIATFIEFTDTNGMTDKEIYEMVKSHIEK